MFNNNAKQKTNNKQIKTNKKQANKQTNKNKQNTSKQIKTNKQNKTKTTRAKQGKTNGFHRYFWQLLYGPKSLLLAT